MAKAPTGVNAGGYFRYWDSLPQISTNNPTVPAYLSTPPNPSVAVGPDDIITIVNRTIARFPNPNSAGQCQTAGGAPGCASSPYTNNPTSQQFLDPWIGITDQNTLCPTVPRSNSTCVIDNASVRYDQMQGRFVVLFTVTDVPAHSSNWFLVVSRFATFSPGPGASPTGSLFTPPIAPIVAGTSTGGVCGGATSGPNGCNWIRYMIPINVVLPFTAGQAAQGGATGTAGGPFCTTPNLGGDPASAGPPGAAGPVTQGCSNYYPTGARMGLDNDNIILTAPVLDMSQAPAVNPGGPQLYPALPGGPYAGTRIATVPKLFVYNGIALPLAFPTFPLTSNTLGAVNLADDFRTGTYTTALGNPFAAPIPNATQNPNQSFINPIPPIFWEPDNVRGRALASFDAQIGPQGTPQNGVITPIDYLVGTWVTGLQHNNIAAGTGQPGFGIFANLGALTLYVQTILFTCPGAAIFPPPAGVAFCGIPSSSTLPGGTQIAELPTLGSGNLGPPITVFTAAPRTTTSSIAVFSDASLVGQSNANDGTDERLRRLYVGDSRPAQVILREGLLYVARTARIWDSSGNARGSSTVIYDIIKQNGASCTGAQGAFCTSNAGTITIAADGISVTAGSIGAVFTQDWVGRTVTINGLLFTVASVTDSTHLKLTSSVIAAGLVAPFSMSFSGGNPYTTPSLGTGTGSTIPNPYVIIETEWTNVLSSAQPVGQNVPCSATPVSYLASGVSFGVPLNCDPNQFGFYAPMYDTPANVISAGPVSPIALFPWLEKLFVGMTTGDTSNTASTFPQTQPGMSHPSLWDFRPGDDAFDSILPVLDPYTGFVYGNAGATGLSGPIACFPGYNGFQGNTFPSATNTCPMVTLATRGGASTDPNDGSLWMYGAFAKNRLGTIPGPGQWGTSIANYALDFPATDPYNNDNTFFADVQPGSQFFVWIQIAKNLGIANSKGTTTTNCPSGGNPPIVPPPGPGGVITTPGPNTLSCNLFGPADQVTRSEMARWVVAGQMNDDQVLTYLDATGGNPNANIHASSFADVTAGETASCGSTTLPCIDYIEIMARRGYTKGCATTVDATHAYCPAVLVTRAQMAVFLIRAKMNNVFPTTLSGIPFFTGTPSNYGDNFNFFTPAAAYFTDVPALGACNVAVPPAGCSAGDAFGYIQKMRELRITNGETGSTYGPDDKLQRQQIATFIVRAFFL